MDKKLLNKVYDKTITNRLPNRDKKQKKYLVDYLTNHFLHDNDFEVISESDVTINKNMGMCLGTFNAVLEKIPDLKIVNRKYKNHKNKLLKFNLHKDFIEELETHLSDFNFSFDDLFLIRICERLAIELSVFVILSNNNTIGYANKPLIDKYDFIFNEMTNCYEVELYYQYSTH
jgi:hypothetical protein